MAKQKSPYEVLGVGKRATKEEIDKAYTKLRLKYHPDRKTGDRAMYDKLVEAYNKINLQPVQHYVEVEKFKSAYKGSVEEDLVNLYLKHKGDINKILQHHILCEDEDEKRLREILEREISKRQLKVFKRFSRQSEINGKRKEKEAKKAERLAGELGIDLNQSLEEILNGSRKKQESFLDDLERKYCRRLN